MRAAASKGSRPALTIRREDRNRETGARGQRQLVQVMTLIEGALAHGRVRVEVDGRSQYGLVAVRIEFQPTDAARRDESLEARRNAREVVGDARPELADAGIEGEAHADLDVVVEDARERVQPRGAAAE